MKECRIKANEEKGKKGKYTTWQVRERKEEKRKSVMFTRLSIFKYGSKLTYHSKIFNSRF